MEEDTEYLKLPIEDRCQHKLWKARVNGYEAATKLFQQLDDKSKEWTKYLGLVRKFVADGNAVAQEKGLEAILAFVENANCAGKTCEEVVSGIVAKCLGAPKAKTKEKAVEIILMYIEIEKYDSVQEELMKGLSAKTPKVVAACIQTLREALRDFGPKVISIKPLLKQAPTLLEDRDKIVRDEAKLLVVEIYRWIGSAIKPQLTTLKPVQLTELEAEFEKIGTQKAVQTRFLRSQQQLREKAQQVPNGLPTDGSDLPQSDVVEETIDPLEFVEAVEILSKLPKDFYDKCEAKKWQERKEAMDALSELTSLPKLENGDYYDLVKVLKQIISKDANVVVVAAAGKCLSGLAKGLGKKFQPNAAQCIPVLLDKFKEKKQNVVQAMREAIDAVYISTNIEAVLEDLIAALDNKNPSVKNETASFLTRCFTRATPAILNKKVLKALCPTLLKTLNDTDPQVRDNSADALGTAMKVVGEKIMMPFIQEVDSIKMTKIKEFHDKAEVVQKKVAKAAPEVSKSPPPEKGATAIANTVKKVSDARPPSKPLSSGASKSSAATKKTVSKTVSAKSKSAAPVDSTSLEFTEKDLSDMEVEEKVLSILSQEILSGLGDSNWKTRLASIEHIFEVVKGLDRECIPSQALVRTLAKKPGLKDNNFQVLKLKLDVIAYLATNSRFSRRSVPYCIEDLADKIGDVKNGPAAAVALTAIAEATKLEFISSQVLDMVFAQKNPKNQAEAMNWLANSIKEFGFVIQVKSIIDHTKKALAATNPAVRTAAITLLGVMYLYMGPTLRVFFENEKSALLQQIDAEFEKLQGMTPPAPVRGLAPQVEGVGDEDECGSVEKAQALKLEDLIPRTDISDQLTGSLMDELVDKNWKVRGEALQKLALILQDAKFITPNLGDLPNPLRARIGDSNKNLSNQALNICQTIVTAMGPSGVRYVRILGPGVLVALGDSKNTIRSAALSCLNAWVAQVGVAPFVESDMMTEALKLENPLLRVEVYTWLAECLPTVKSLPSDLSLCLPYLFAALEDRNVDVRKKAQDAVLPFMIHLSYDAMARTSGKLKPASKAVVMGVLDKAKPNLPAKPPPKAKVVKPPSAAPSAPSASPASCAKDDSLSSNEDASKLAARGRQVSATSKGKALGKSVPVKRKDEEVDTSAPLLLNSMKDQRILDEQKLKVLKWTFTQPREEFYDLLKDQMTTAGFGKPLLANLFHNDFKYHIKAIDTLIECLENLPDATIANADLVLKWIALRFFDTNPSVLLKSLEYLHSLFALFADKGYNIHDYELNSFIPYLILKAGDPKDTVRQAVRNIFKRMYKVCPASKIFPLLMEGLKSKNSRQRAECLEELGNLIETYGMIVCQPNPSTALKEMAKQISDRDNGVRNAALNSVAQAYFLDGEKVYKYVGPIADKDISLLEERIKRLSKNRISAVAMRMSPPEVKSRSPKASPALNPVENVQKEVEVQEIVKRPRASVIPVRPVSGAFTLDLDQIEQMMEERAERELPKLIMPDLGDIFAGPIHLPGGRVRPSSPVMKHLGGSLDVSSTMDLVISQVASNDIDTSIQALAQFDELFKDAERADTIASRVDQFLVATSLQYRMTYTKHLGDESTKKSDVIRLYRCLTMTLVSLFYHRALAKRVSKDVLRDLIYNLVTILLDTRLNTLEDGPQVIRAINVLVVKIVERSNHTNIVSALLKLLHDCVLNDNITSKFTELVMKCLWKMIRLLPEIINELDLDHILLDLHLFLKAFPSSQWKEKPSDIPLRTVKTILHSLAKLKGNKIMGHLSLVQNLQDSEIEPYLQKVLKGGVKHRSSSSTKASSEVRESRLDQSVDHGTNRKEASSADVILICLILQSITKSRQSPRRLSKTTHEMLADIFKKIGSKENTREGLSDLYEFKRRFPDADIEPFLRKSSQFFQNYIERGLRNIELERTGRLPDTMMQKHMPIRSSTGSIPNAIESALSAGPFTGSEADLPPSVYLERLKMLRARCGLDNSEYESSNTAAMSKVTLTKAMSIESHVTDDDIGKTSVFKAESRVAIQGVPRSNSSETIGSLSAVGANLDDLRRRLERVKNAAAT